MKKIRQPGYHLLGTILHCDPKVINNYNMLYDFLLNFPEVIGMTRIPFKDNPRLESFPLLESCVNDKDPNNYGHSGMVLLFQSHFSFHAWPEYDNSIDFDLFSCDVFEPDAIKNILTNFFGGEMGSCVLVVRDHYGCRKVDHK